MSVANVAWGDLSLAFAFLLGYLVGVITVLRLISVVGRAVRRERDRSDAPRADDPQ